MDTDVKIYNKEPQGFSCRTQVAACYLEMDRKLLILQRAAHKSEEGKWGVPACKLEKNETPIDAAVRELFEETGIRVDLVSQVRFLGSLYIRKPEIDYVYHIIKIEMHEIPSIRLSGEHQDYQWASCQEMQQIPLMAGANEALQSYFVMKGKT